MKMELVYGLIILIGGEMGLLISVPGASLSAGLSVSPQDFDSLPRTCPRTMEMR
jgi:hypothetical protein